MSKKAIKLALEALKVERDNYLDYSTEDGAPEYIYEAIRSLEFEVAKQEQGEPVAWADHGVVNWIADKQFKHAALLYEHPQQRTWVGLTDVEWMNIVNKDQAWFGQRPDEVAHEVAKLVEAKLKEKNT